ncbi:MAG: M20 family metallo-hydrolase [Armatimonadota bacterium]
MQNTMNIQKLYEKIDSYKDESIKMQEELTAIPALSPDSDGDGELKKAELIKKYMDKLRYDSFEEYNAPDERVSSGIRPNHIYRFKGEDSERTVWIMAHFDIVPPGEASHWDTDPYKVKADGDFIYGRGVEDNQQGMISAMLAVKALKEQGLKPKYDTAFLFISDEETGSKYGIQYLLEQNPDIFKKEDLMVIPDAGNEDGTMIEVAEKSIIWFKFKVIGKQTHGSRPYGGINAFKAGSILVTKLYELNKIFGKSDPIFDPPESTFEPTKKEANVPNINTIPGEDVFCYDCRILPDYNIQDVLAEVDKMCKEVEKEEGVKISYETPQKEQAAPATPADCQLVKSLAKAVKEVTGFSAKPMGIGGGTVAAYIRRKHIPAVVWFTRDATGHQPNESCRISHMLSDAKVFVNLFINL